MRINPPITYHMPMGPIKRTSLLTFLKTIEHKDIDSDQPFVTIATLDTNHLNGIIEQNVPPQEPSGYRRRTLILSSYLEFLRPDIVSQITRFDYQPEESFEENLCNMSVKSGYEMGIPDHMVSLGFNIGLNAHIFGLLCSHDFVFYHTGKFRGALGCHYPKRNFRFILQKRNSK